MPGQKQENMARFEGLGLQISVEHWLFTIYIEIKYDIRERKLPGWCFKRTNQIGKHPWICTFAHLFDDFLRIPRSRIAVCRFSELLINIPEVSSSWLCVRLQEYPPSTFHLVCICGSRAWWHFLRAVGLLGEVRIEHVYKLLRWQSDVNIGLFLFILIPLV